MNEIMEIRQQVRLNQWSAMVREREDSGLSVKAFCKQAGISPKTYYYRLRRLREAAIKQTQLGTVQPTTSQPELVQYDPSRQHHYLGSMGRTVQGQSRLEPCVGRSAGQHHSALAHGHSSAGTRLEPDDHPASARQSELCRHSCTLYKRIRFSLIPQRERRIYPEGSHTGWYYSKGGPALRQSKRTGKRTQCRRPRDTREGHPKVVLLFYLLSNQLNFYVT